MTNCNVKLHIRNNPGITWMTGAVEGAGQVGTVPVLPAHTPLQALVLIPDIVVADHTKFWIRFLAKFGSRALLLEQREIFKNYIEFIF